MITCNGLSGVKVISGLGHSIVLKAVVGWGALVQCWLESFKWMEARYVAQKHAYSAGLRYSCYFQAP